MQASNNLLKMVFEKVPDVSNLVSSIKPTIALNINVQSFNKTLLHPNISLFSNTSIK